MGIWRLAPILFLAHALGMLVDEVRFHRRRGLPAWERWGHPLDTLTVLACYLILLFLPRVPGAFGLYLGAAVFSCLFVTKDEWIHARNCTGGEMWLHAVLFTMHPVLLAIAGAWRFAGPGGNNPVTMIGMGGMGSPAAGAFFGLFLLGQTAVTAAFMAYQLLYWNGPWKPSIPSP